MPGKVRKDSVIFSISFELSLSENLYSKDPYTFEVYCSFISANAAEGYVHAGLHLEKHCQRAKEVVLVFPCIHQL